tara:strand:- start:890 stop:1642 length:753 start_codon:yes stop_codon:yes gene_type:complete
LIVFSKTFLIVVSIILLAPFQYLFVKLNLRLKVYIPKLFHKIVLKVIGIKVKLIGEYSRLRPLVLIGNHTSYLDIIILGSIMPICFIAKYEIRGWFLFGFLAKMQNTIFINRKNQKTLESIKNINKHLKNESAVVLFPEGTTNTGKKLLDFKSSLFNMFENNSILRLQNFSLCYTHVNDMPIDDRTRPQVSWYGDMNMISHLTNLLKLSCINVTVVFHKSLPIVGMNRKQISSYSHKQVKEGIDLAIDGI